MDQGLFDRIKDFPLKGYPFINGIISAAVMLLVLTALFSVIS